MAEREPKVLTFDVVGTIIDFEAGLLAYLRGACGAAAEKVTDAAILDAYRLSRGSKEAWRFPDDLERVYGEIAPQFGLPADAAIAKGFAQSARDWPPFADSIEALQRLGRRYKLVAMTNAARWALDLMSARLGHPFHDTVTADEALCEKPDPQYFAFTRGRLSRDGFTQADILHVAQSQYHDIGVARRLGYTVCWIERRMGMKGAGGTIAAERTEPHYHFATLRELADHAEAGRLVMRT
ncbi:HAD-IA family hydrolase [Neoroseomonas oryzicola]|uniref:HAD-IA family hydrolase n=1 Tax=Neoroseomonas oryzicola TaxID=535904 RepID=A0A9X9WBE2_9PROT|nr:HAD-IA family hydrolase [Neoroseomonas oryzicola]MBR0657652.1 HAD-IA family hydrolase [Neoroseomonas oryzicola]NKE18908.1 HAD-IA family hydrolase [Neoroseomonas oryzicola]